MRDTIAHSRAAIAYRPYSRCVAMALATLVMMPAGAEDALRAPVASRNLAPVYGSLGIPPMQDAAGLAAGDWTAGWSLYWASHAVRERAGDVMLEFDGETQRHDFRVQVGVGNAITLTVNVPWVRHSGGSLDALIDGWHAFWGMPDGPRRWSVRTRPSLRLLGPRRAGPRLGWSAAERSHDAARRGAIGCTRSPHE